MSGDYILLPSGLEAASKTKRKRGEAVDAPEAAALAEAAE